MNISLIFTLMSYMGVSVANKLIVNYKYNTIFKKMIKEMVKNGYKINSDNIEEFASFILKNSKNQLYDYNFNDGSKEATNILSLWPGVNLIYFLLNTEFLIYREYFEYKGHNLATDKEFLCELEKNNIIEKSSKSLKLKYIEDSTNR